MGTGRGAKDGVTGVNLLTDKGILAIGKQRWPQVNRRTNIAPTSSKKLVVPVYEKDDRPVMERWTSMLEGNDLPKHGQVTIELEPVEDVPGVVAMGYDAEVDVLAVTLSK